jgi:ATP-dependent helicase HrpB
MQQTVRPELRALVMSATLDVDAVSVYLDGSPIISAEGRLHPVDVSYEPRPDRLSGPLAAAQATERLLHSMDGDILVFLPGLYEIRQTARHLEPITRELDLAVLPLHGDLPPEQQDAALLPQPRRKVVLATNVAETSVTVEGVIGVVDTGLARILAFDPGVGLDRLRLAPISRASAEQRAGRAGRLRPGVCVRLWSAAAQRSRPEQAQPEIRRVDLAGAVLQLLCLGETDLDHFPWLDPPPSATVTQAQTLLRRLGAIDEKDVTERGRALVRLPVHPRLGGLLLEGLRWGCPERATLAAALLSERDPFSPTHERDAPWGRRHVSQSDLLDRVEAMEEFERRRGGDAVGPLNRSAARFVLRARDHLLRALQQERRRMKTFPDPPMPESADDALLRALLAAFPDRLARRREPGGSHGVMVGGRGVRLTEASRVREAELFLCIDVDAGQGETLVRLASAVQREWLPPERLTTRTEATFDADAERVTARKTLRFEDLVLEETQAALPSEEETARVLEDAAAQHLPRVLPPDDSDAARFRTRVRCLRQWMPELQLPELGDAELRTLLTGLCHGRRSFAELRAAPWLEAMQSSLSPRQLLAIEREAPERLAVPSGSRLALRYEEGRPPVLAVRIQEVFGLRDSPRVAGGRVRVLLHLLAPNHRPQQVTDDLASFWANTYPQVRKELRARYPKHAWPEDPWTAVPESRPRRRS